MTDAPARERTFQWPDPVPIAAALRAAPGLDALQGMVDGVIPHPPIAQLLGFRLVRVARGEADFTYQPHESHYSPIGAVHGGVLASVCDAALGCATHTMLPLGVGYTTLELSTNFTRSIARDTPLLTCRAKAVHTGRRVATGEATMTDAAGKLYGHAKATQLVLAP